MKTIDLEIPLFFKDEDLQNAFNSIENLNSFLECQIIYVECEAIHAFIEKLRSMIREKPYNY